MKIHPVKCLLAMLLIAITVSASARAGREYYQIRVYHLKTNEQVALTDDFLKNAYLPALHRYGIGKVGIYKPIGNDTAAEKSIYVFVPLKSAEQLSILEDKLNSDAAFREKGAAYLGVAHDKPAYARMETILLRAFKLMPQHHAPALSGEPSQRIYELRSYEGASEKLYGQKVHMFNEGGEISLFNRLGFNAVFYAEVLAGSRMPNLVYMTSFDNKVSRDAHWKTFSADAEWKRMSALPEYQHTVSKADIILMHPADYSEL